MTLDDLIEALTDIRDAGTPGATDVRLAIQPRWAFEHDIATVALVDLAADPEDARDDDRLEPEQPVVYIGEGSQLGYLPAAAQSTVWAR